MRRTLLALVPLALAPASQARTPTTALEVLARFAHEPSVRAVQRAAARWVGAEPERLAGWRSRVRKAPWLPQLRAKVQRGLEDDLLLNANGPTRALDDDLLLEVQLRWDLDRLVFDRNELFLSREAALLAELRHDIVAEVTRIYFERRRLQVEMTLQPPASVEARTRLLLRIEELTAELDAHTGGFFGRALRRGVRR